MNDWRYAKNKNIEIRIDLVRPESNVEYRVIGEEEWEPTPFQSYSFGRAGGEVQAALKTVDKWSGSY